MSFLNAGPQHRAWNLLLGETGQFVCEDGPVWLPESINSGRWRDAGANQFGTYAIAGGTPGIDRILWSSDFGQTWNIATGITPSTSGELRSICWAPVGTTPPGTWLAEGAPGGVQISTDGAQTWSPINPVPSIPNDRIRFLNGLFWTLDLAGSNIAAKSPNGISWTNTTLPALDGWQDIAYGNGRYIALGAASGFAVSLDGVTWTAGAVFSANYQRLAFGNGVFVAIDRTNANVRVTVDGLTTVVVPVATPFRTVLFAQGVFLGATTDRFYVSRDGLTWSLSPYSMPFTANWGAVVYNGGSGYLAVATDVNASTAAALGVCASSPLPPLPWDNAARDADIALSNDNRTASITTATGAVRSMTSHTNDGNGYYAEITLLTSTEALMGLMTSAASLAQYPGQNANSWAYDSISGARYTNDVPVAYGPAATTGNVIGILYSGGALTFSRNGVSMGVAFSGLNAGPYFLGWGAFQSPAGLRSCTLNTGQAPFSFAPPGALPWG